MTNYWSKKMKKILAAITLLFSFSLPALADEQDQLVGVWKLQTYEVEFQDADERKAPFGDHPNGFIIFTHEGRMMAVLTPEGRKVPQTDADQAAAFRNMFAYSGIYRVEGDSWITKVDTAWNEAWIGTDQIRFYRLDGDELTVTSNWRPYPMFDGRVARGLLTWTRDR
jgi:Lipocalin-like domain